MKDKLPEESVVWTVLNIWLLSTYLLHAYCVLGAVPGAGIVKFTTALRDSQAPPGPIRRAIVLEQVFISPFSK